ncbi:GNAT family N-acetyltransferase [Paenibacillus sp. 481]|uniref:GNAT family N-acetyltransferase n=1 Tax=Paenibacillus sp. 481 TaxID=2835869 RepID=UPI001E57754E|nr:GNAT family N-acetyltransferase [Paenibacillus sp. 481]UHA75151.1 GNAT family N-acetyltransferase [Paenibacillus sp. 481]
MIHELDRNQFYRCKNLVNRGVNIEEKAIVEGAHSGRIFVDNIENPRSGLIWQGNNDGFIFIGDSQNKTFNHDIKRYIDDVISVQAKEQGVEWFECIGNHQSWYTTFHEIFSDKALKSWDQNVYMISPSSFNSTAKQQDNEDEFIVEQVTKQFLENKEINNMEFVRSKIMEFWESEATFFEQGIGFCMLHNHDVVSLCISGYRYKDIHGIDIETIESYQGRKLAQRVVYYFVDYCFANGCTPYWDCMEVNYPSNAVAKNIGFTKEFGYKGFEYKL